MIGQQGQEILTTGRITAEDVLALRQKVYGKPIVTEEDAELLFRLNDEISEDADPEWPIFFVEAMTDYLVNQAVPRGYVSEENAEWLISRIAHSGRVEIATELKLLVRILDRAKSNPVRLVRFALDEVKRAVLSGEGCMGRGRTLTPGVIAEAEVELIRRILYAFGGDGNVAITRSEAEVLFDINDATIEAENDPAWSDLFVKAIANFLLVGSGYRPPTREEALRRDAWLNSPAEGVRSFMRRMLVDGLINRISAYTSPGSGDVAGFALIVDKPVSEPDLAWVVERIGRDGVLHENEQALIDFLKRQRPQLHPELARLLSRLDAD